MTKRFKTLLSTAAVIAATGTAAYVVAPTPAAFAAMTQDGYVHAIDQGEHYASDLIGSTVYTSAADDAEAIGDVNDLVLDPDGGVQAVIIGVGGFLGIGEKDVGVAYDQLEWQTGDNGETWPVLNTTQEALENAPAFERSMDTAETEPATGEEVAMTDAPATDDQMADEQVGDADAEIVAVTDEEPAETDTAMTDEEPADTDTAMTDEEPVDTDTAMTDEQPADTDTAMTDEPDAAMDGERDQVANSPVDGLETYDTSLLSAEELIDTTVYGSDGEDVGEISDVLLSDGGEIDAIVIDVGGFLGIGEKPVAINFEDLRVAIDQNENLIVQTAFTYDELEAAPEYDETAYRENKDNVVLRTKS